jgi:hypothetical protein
MLPVGLIIVFCLRWAKARCREFFPESPNFCHQECSVVKRQCKLYKENIKLSSCNMGKCNPLRTPKSRKGNQNIFNLATDIIFLQFTSHCHIELKNATRGAYYSFGLRWAKARCRGFFPWESKLLPSSMFCRKEAMQTIQGEHKTLEL